MGIGGIGPTELIIVLVIALLILGPKRLPEVGRSIGHGMREFKDSISGNNKDEDDEEIEIHAASTRATPKDAPVADATPEPVTTPVTPAAASPAATPGAGTSSTGS